MTPVPPIQSKDELLSWLSKKLADYTRGDPRDIAPDVSLSSYGLDSVFVLTFVGDIEDYLGIELDPTIIWDYDTLGSLAEYLLPKIGAK
jgi:acyl carrier protein